MLLWATHVHPTIPVFTLTYLTINEVEHFDHLDISFWKYFYESNVHLFFEKHFFNLCLGNIYILWATTLAVYMCAHIFSQLTPCFITIFIHFNE